MDQILPLQKKFFNSFFILLTTYFYCRFVIYVKFGVRRYFELFILRKKNFDQNFRRGCIVNFCPRLFRPIFQKIHFDTWFWSSLMFCRVYFQLSNPLLEVDLRYKLERKSAATELAIFSSFSQRKSIPIASVRQTNAAIRFLCPENPPNRFQTWVNSWFQNIFQMPFSWQIFQPGFFHQISTSSISLSNGNFLDQNLTLKRMAVSELTNS